MLWLFRYIKGFIVIRLWGEYAEQLINKAIKSGVFLWDIKYTENAITGCITVKDFKYLLVLRRNARAKIKIIDKYGLPFFIHRYRKRAGFLAGACFFFAVLEILSLFIWSVEVSGNNKVREEEILSACEKIGVYEGVQKSRIDSKNMADRLLLELPNLAWCSFNIEGSLVTVNVTEVKNQPDKNSNMPSNLIAKEDGIIKKIDVTAGNSLVKVGDAVARGDVLVSGIKESMSSTVFLRSKGTVTAEIEKTFKAEGNFVKIQNKPTGKTKKLTTLNALGLKIPLGFIRLKGDYYSNISHKQLKISEKKLPFSTSTKTFYFTEKKKITYNDTQLEKILKEDIEKQIKSYGEENYTVKNEEIIKTEKGITVLKTVIITTNIATEKEITVKNE